MVIVIQDIHSRLLKFYNRIYKKQILTIKKHIIACSRDISNGYKIIGIIISILYMKTQSLQKIIIYHFLRWSVVFI